MKNIFFNIKKFYGLIFCIFLSLFFWLITKLSMTYTEKITLNATYKDLPNEMELDPKFKQKITFEVKGSGFSILKYHLLKKNIVLSMNYLNHISEEKYTWKKDVKNLINKEILPEFSLNSIHTDTIFIKFDKLGEKKVPVILRNNVKIATDHQIKNIQLSSDSINIYGKQNLLKNIENYILEIDKKNEINASFSENFNIKDNEKFSYQPNRISVNFNIIKISEQEISCPIHILNSPENKKVKLFPNKVNVLLKGNIEILSKLSENSVIISVDFSKQKNNRIPLKISKLPQDLTAHLSHKEVDFLLE